VKPRLYCENLLKFKKINVKRNVQVKMNGIYKQEKNDCTWYVIISKIQWCWSSHRLLAWLDNKTGNVYDQGLFVLPLCKIRIIPFLVPNHKLIEPVFHPLRFLPPQGSLSGFRARL